MSNPDKPQADDPEIDKSAPESGAQDETPMDNMSADEASVLTPIALASSAAAQTQGQDHKGRLADKLAAIIAAAALALSLLLTALFFIGFIVNDYHSGAVLSAFAFSVGLASFAVIPLAVISVLARKAFRQGGTRGLYAWSIFLIIPWFILAVLWVLYTPLPVWMSSLAVLFALILMLWAVISLVLEFKSSKAKAPQVIDIND